MRTSTQTPCNILVLIAHWQSMAAGGPNAKTEHMGLMTEGLRTAGTIVIRIAGRVDGETAPDLARVCRQVLAPDDRNMILDFAEVLYVSSAGLSTVLAAGKRISRQGGQLLICGLTPRLKEIFEISGFSTLFSFFENRQDALAECAGGIN